MQRAWSLALTALILCFAAPVGHADTVASLLGNFTINQYCGLKLASGGLDVHYVVVFGQLPALRELHLADADGNGITSQAERDAYVGTLAPTFAKALVLRLDGVRLPLHATQWTSSLPTEQGGFSLRVDVDFAATLPPAPRLTPGAPSARQLEFSNDNYAGRMGWHEIVVDAAPGLAVFDTNGYASSLTGGLTQALQTLPAAGPLDERSVHLRFTAGEAPAGAALLAERPAGGSTSGSATSTAGLDRAPGTGAAPAIGAAAGRGSGGASETAWLAQRTRQLVDAISGPRLEPRIAILALLGALLLGAVHALSPGHGKTIVGAYLIGSRGTPRHALFLGLTVTVTHTVGVFALGFATLYASRFIVPERLFPVLSLVSAVLVLGMGIALLVQRARALRHALGPAAAGSTAFRLVPSAPLPAGGSRGLIFAPALRPADATLHSHGGGPLHSHLPPGAAGEKITWRSLATLGISGGLIPCPSAMVILLAAVALNKTVYGMLLVVAFSLGLAMTLTVVGLIFLYARNRLRGPRAGSRWPQLLPVLSAGAITLVGVVLCCGALKSWGT
jgi:ABC-type nickel/cobalt efflux system permease component RcnA